MVPVTGEVSTACSVNAFCFVQDQPTIAYSSELVERALSVMEAACDPQGTTRLVTLEMAMNVLDELCYVPDAPGPALRARHIERLEVCHGRFGTF